MARIVFSSEAARSLSQICALRKSRDRRAIVRRYDDPSRSGVRMTQIKSTGLLSGAPTSIGFFNFIKTFRAFCRPLIGRCIIDRPSPIAEGLCLSVSLKRSERIRSLIPITFAISCATSRVSCFLFGTTSDGMTRSKAMDGSDGMERSVINVEIPFSA